MERQGSMHFNLRKAAGIVAFPLLGSALIVGVAALPASAATWHDTALQAFNVPTTPAGTGATVNGVVAGSGQGSTLSFTAPNGEVFASPSFTVGSTDAKLTTSASGSLVLTSKGTATGSGTLTFTIKSANSNITCTAAETVAVSETAGTLGESSAPKAVPGETVAVSFVNDNSTGDVQFTGTVTGQSCTVTFSEQNLPAGLASGNPLVPGSAIPRTGASFYSGVGYTATDPLGSTFRGTFDLHVFGYQVQSQGNYGNEVNPFGNGLDVYQQHEYPGAIIAGWTATQADRATHFIRNNGTHSGAYQFEYAPGGSGSGLCVSDPGGGWGSDPLPDGLILTSCNTGPWQQFVPQSDGTLRNLATGLFVNPDGTGAQLRGGTAPSPWGGSVYTWTDYANLPG
jgi:hypothetical protein